MFYTMNFHIFFFTKFGDRQKLEQERLNEIINELESVYCLNFICEKSKEGLDLNFINVESAINPQHYYFTNYFKPCFVYEHFLMSVEINHEVKKEQDEERLLHGVKSSNQLRSDQHMNTLESQHLTKQKSDLKLQRVDLFSWNSDDPVQSTNQNSEPKQEGKVIGFSDEGNSGDDFAEIIDTSRLVKRWGRLTLRKGFRPNSRDYGKWGNLESAKKFELQLGNWSGVKILQTRHRVNAVQRGIVFI